MQAEIIDYRLKRNNQPDAMERADLKARLYKFTNQTNVSNLFKTSIQNINAAFRGGNSMLMNKLKIYIEKMEAKNNGVEK